MKKRNLLGPAVVGIILASVSLQAGPFVIGDVFASTGNGVVRVYSQTGVFKAQLDTGLGGFTTGSTFDAAGNFYVTAFSANDVSKFDANGNLVNATWSSGFGSENESIVFNQAGNAFIGYAGVQQVQEVNAAGAHLATFNVASNTDWIDLAADQTTLIYSDESNTIHRWNVGTNVAMTDLASGSGPFYAKRVIPGTGDVLVASGSGNVYRFSSAGVLLQTYAIGIGSVFALNLDPNGTAFWTGSTGGTAIKEISISTGATLQSWGTGVGTLFGLSVLGEIQAGGGGVTGNAPEPSSIAMLGLALAGIGAWKLRRKA